MVVLSRGVNFIGLTFHSATLIKNLHALHLDEWRFHLIKRFCWKSWEKSVFNCGVDSLGPWGGRFVSLWDLFYIWGFWQSFSRKIAFGRTVHGSKADGPKLTSNHTEWCAAREVRADGPRPTHRRSATYPQTVREALADSPPSATGNSNSRWLYVFTIGIQTQTVREVHIFDIIASNGMGEYKYSMPGLGEPLLALWKVHTPL
jgi:hypothetical protein